MTSGIPPDGNKIMNGKNIESGRMAVAVLVGGRSIRMGLPKESVVIPDDGRTFLERICDEVDIISERLFVARYLSVRDGQCIERDGYINVPDRYAGIGPIGGIYSSLEKAAEDGAGSVLILACDLIGYDHNEITGICDSYKGEDILFARTGDGRLQPLASVYSADILPAVRDLIERGKYRITDLSDTCANVGYYDTFRNECYINQNTPFNK